MRYGGCNLDVVKQSLGEASCYIDSFPVDGGTVFAQALMSGTPVFGPNTSEAPGVSPLNSLRSNSMTEMSNHLQSYLSGTYKLDKFVNVARKVTKLLSRQAVAQRLTNVTKGVYAPLPDELRELGNRSIDFNADRWRQKGIVHLPRDHWRKLSLGGRLKLLSQFRRSDISSKTKQRLKLLLLVG